MSNNILNGNVQTLKDILAKWEEHEKTVGDVELLMSKVRGLNRDIDAMDKKTKGLIDAAVKKHKDGITSGIDKSIARETDKLKKAKTERDKALAKGKAKRMQDGFLRRQHHLWMQRLGSSQRRGTVYACLRQACGRNPGAART